MIEDTGETGVEGDQDQQEKKSGFSGVEVVSVVLYGINRVMGPDVFLVSRILDGLLTERKDTHEEDKNGGNSEPETITVTDGDAEVSTVTELIHERVVVNVAGGSHNLGRVDVAVISGGESGGSLNKILEVVDFAGGGVDWATVDVPSGLLAWRIVEGSGV